MKYSPCPIWNITAPEESAGDRDGKLMNSPRAGRQVFHYSNSYCMLDAT